MIDETQDAGENESPPAILGTAKRVAESFVVAIGASAGLYLIGYVYTSAYYGRMSIEVTALDLTPPYITLQAAHVVESLVQYPLEVLFLYLIYRLLSTRLTRVRNWYARAQRRFGRLFLLVVNFAIVLPLLVSAFQAEFMAGLSEDRSVLGDVAELMFTFAGILIIYLIWLSLGPRDVILNQIRDWKLIPIALVFALYLLDALVATAHRAALDAELLMTGESAASIQAVFDLVEGAGNPLPSNTELILVTARNSNYFVVERQPLPPSERPLAYAVPFSWVISVRTQRIRSATVELEDLLDDEPFATPELPFMFGQ